MVRSVRTALVVSFAFVAGCGSGATTSSIADLHARADTAYCQAAVKCGLIPDVARCKPKAHWDYARLQADVAASKTTYDGTKAAACLDALYGHQSEGLCGLLHVTYPPSFPVPFGNPILAPYWDPPACRAMFTGTVAPGGTCCTHEECASRSCWAPGGGPPTCTTVPAGSVALDGTCTSMLDCVDGTLCGGWNADSGVCTAIGALGEECGHYCALDLTCPSGGLFCAKPPGEGDSCFGVFCGSGAHYCDSTCKRRLAVGSPCDPSAEQCVKWALCDQTSRTCKERSGVGDPCKSFFDCQFGLWCEGDVCVVNHESFLCPAS